MKHKLHRAPAGRLTTVALSIMLIGGSALSFIPHTALAQDTTASVSRSYNIPAGPLGNALAEFSAVSGVRLVFDPALLHGKSTAGLHGNYTIHAGFIQLLQNNGYQAVARRKGEYVLEAIPLNNESATVLPTITIKADHSTTEGSGSYTTRAMSAASKLNLSIRDTPQSVSIVTRELLDDSNALTLTDVLRLVPGAVIESSGPGYSNTIVRGFTLNNLQVDGVSFNQASGFDDYLFDTLNTASLDRVEVVRGATGIVTGNGQPSGTVNVVRKRPTREFQANVKASVANYSTYASELDIRGALNTEGTLRGRAVARVEDQRDHYQGYYRKRKPMFYGVLDADLGPDTTVSLAVDWQRVDGDGLANFRALTGMYADGSRFVVPRKLNLSPSWERADQERKSATLSLEHALSEDWKLKLAYVRQNSALNYKFLEVGLPQTNGNVTGNYGTRNDYDSRRELFEASIDGLFTLFGRQHKAVIGYVNSRQNTLADTHWEGSTLPPINYHTFNPGLYPEPEWWKVLTSQYHVRTSAAYASSLWSLAEPLKLQIGGRWSNYKQKENVLYEDYGYSGSGGLPYQSADYEHRGVFTPFVGLVYDFHPIASVYSSFARTFQIQNDAVRNRNGQLLDPREGTNLEFGIKVEPNPDLTLSAALFQLKQTNVAVQAGEFTGSDAIRYGRYYYEGGAGQKTNGLELEISGALTQQWQVSGGYTRQNIKHSDGSRYQTLPRDLIKLATQYRLSGDLQGITIGGALHWQSSRESVRWSNGASFNLPSYTLLSAWAAYRVNPRLTTRLNITNLTDTTYQSNSNNFVNYGEARRIGISMDYRF